ncbi:hypothetical protein ABFS83_14G033800 [Erythranthe nasuta]
MADDKSDLPPEIIEIILSKLSVKSLLRFKSVSKSWNTMITDPVFVQNHIRRSKYSNSTNLVLCLTYETSPFQFSMVKLEDKKFQTLPVEIEAPFGCESVLCFCEGMILLTCGTRQRLVLWNPSTRTAEKLWHRFCCSDAAFGLCRDPNTDDFKVVVADWYYYSVYSCKKQSWITMKEEYEIEGYGEGLVDSRSAGLCVDGASYWVWKRRKIIYYDPRDDKFKMLQKPEKLEDCKRIFLVNLRSSLCVYGYFCAATKVQIWTKENGIDSNSWKELMTVQCDMLEYLRPLFFVENKIVLEVYHRILVSYSPSEKKFETIEGDTQLLLLEMAPVPYIESFYFPIEEPKPKRKRKRKLTVVD